jgi:ubiquinone/menaquinone biosynthesis C-methylase UbiE
MYDNELRLFQKSADVLWTDEHISKSMLASHLDESNDGASRKPENRTKIINWINGIVKPNSNIIDLGCGPGLYVYELGVLGHNVLGVDFNPESVRYAQKNKSIKGYVDYKYGNYLKDEIEGKYNAAIMIYFDFGVLIPNEQNILLKRLNNILQNDGLFIFDMYGTKDALNIFNQKKNWQVSKGGDFWSDEPYLLMEETKFFEHEKRMGTRYFLVNQKNGHIKEFIVWEQYYDKDSIYKLMSENGFEIVEINQALMNDNGKTLFIAAKKKSK